VEAQAPGVAVELVADMAHQWLPVAIERLRKDWVLELKVALLRNQPLAVLGQQARRHSRADDWKLIRHRVAPSLACLLTAQATCGRRFSRQP